MTISEIEDAVASGNMSAKQCFTQMRQHCEDTKRLDWLLNYEGSVWLMANRRDIDAKRCEEILSDNK
jgi:hypothetical protein